MSGIQYVTGDATEPSYGAYPKNVIAHVVNNRGGWGSGFVVGLNRTWPAAEGYYRLWFKSQEDLGSSLGLNNFVVQTPSFQLGHTQFIQVSERVVIANMCAQDGYKNADNPHPLVLNMLERCLEDVFTFALHRHAVVHMPRVGSKRGGGNWDEISELIERCMSSHVPEPKVYVYAPSETVRAAEH